MIARRAPGAGLLLVAIACACAPMWWIFGTAQLVVALTVSILVGAELIRPEVLTEFTAAFAPSRLAPSALTPSYGLAEATVGVTAMPADRPFRLVALDPHPAVSCGIPLPGVEVGCTRGGEGDVRCG